MTHWIFHRMFDRLTIFLLYATNIRRILWLKGTGIELDRWELIDTAANWEKWKKVYLPPGGVKGKVVFTFGARAGGDVLFYFMQGARKVIALDYDEECISMLRRNVERFGWDCDIIGRGLRLADFAIPCDFRKLNVEGYEMVMLEGDIPYVPTVTEAHCSYIVDKLKERGFWILDGPYEYLGKCMMANW